jgi:hypothetical protein
MRNNPRPSLSSFKWSQLCFIAISSYWCNCLLAIAVLLIFLEFYTVVHILRIQQHYLPGIHQNYLFRHTKSVVWFHLTRAESQAAMMVGILQGFDIGLFENSAMLMLWLTQLAGRPIDILPWFLKNNHSPWEFLCGLFKKLPLMVSLSNFKVRPLLDIRLMAILKVDFGIYNIGIKVSKCILVSLVEPSPCGNNSF